MELTLKINKKMQGILKELALAVFMITSYLFEQGYPLCWDPT